MVSVWVNFHANIEHFIEPAKLEPKDLCSRSTGSLDEIESRADGMPGLRTQTLRKRYGVSAYIEMTSIEPVEKFSEGMFASPRYPEFSAFDLSFYRTCRGWFESGSIAKR